jgi:regulation of enolase protein 1 (concanavalin A-like superfamily)
VVLGWTAVTGATSYNLSRSTNSSSGFASIGMPSGPSFTDNTAADGTTYYYEVSAGNPSGWSVNSAVASATPPLTGLDIGGPAMAGNFIANNGSYTVNGGGTNVYITADQFYFAYRVWTGDVAIVTRVTSIQNTSIYAKGGIMIRESLSGGSSHATADITPGFGIEFIRRNGTGTVSTNNNFTGLTAPYWLKLTRSLNSITAYRSTDGVNWTLIGNDTVTMAPTVYVGLMVCAQTNNALCAGAFDNFSVTDPWVSGDIGSPSPGGGANVSDLTGTYTVWGSGTNIYGPSDQFHYVSQPMYTNGQIVVTVESFQSGQPVAPWAKGGVMIRQGLTPDAPHTMVDLTGANGVELNYRTNTGGTTIHTVTNGPAAPYWVKLVRSNSTNFTASYSPDGTTWTTVGSGSITNAAMNVNPIYIGLITCSATNGVLCTNVFNNVTITPGP